MMLSSDLDESMVDTEQAAWHPHTKVASSLTNAN